MNETLLHRSVFFDRNENPHAMPTHACSSVWAAAVATAEAATPLKDPVCGMTVTAQSPHALRQDGAAMYFCSAGCKAKFVADPGRYPIAIAGSVVPNAATAQSPAEPIAAAGCVYTCPMRPEVRRAHPGACPKCGMALEPEVPALDDADSPELLDFRRWFF